MAFDPKKYKAASVQAVSESEKETQKLTNQGSGMKGGFVDILTGTNQVRIFPAHEGTPNNLYIFPKSVHWIPQKVWVNKEKKVVSNAFYEKAEDKSGFKQEIRNKPIFNSKVHGNTPKDIFEEYIKITTKFYEEEIVGEDKKNLEKQSKFNEKVKILTDWKKGIQAKTSYIVYGTISNSSGKQFGRIELNQSIKTQMNVMSNRESATTTIVLDPFTDPVNGKAIQVIHNPLENDAKKKYLATLLWEDNWAISQEDGDLFEECEPLYKIYTNCYKNSDFEKAIEGLEIFDAEHKFNMFSQDIWLNVCSEISAYYPEETKEGEAEEEHQETEETTTPSYQFSNPLDQITTKEMLVDFIKVNDLDFKVKPIHTLAVIKNGILNEVLEANGVTQPNADIEISLTELMNNYAKTSILPEEAKEETSAIVEEKTQTDTKKGVSKIESLKGKYAKKA